MLYLQVIKSSIPLSSPSLGSHSYHKVSVPAPKALSLLLPSSLTLYFHGFEIITNWIFPSSKQILSASSICVKLHQTASVCSSLQSVPPSKEMSWNQNKLPSVRQQKPNFLFQAQGKVVSVWGWFPGFSSQSYHIGVCLHDFNLLWVWRELQTENVKHWSNLMSFLMKPNLLRKIWHPDYWHEIKTG